MSRELWVTDATSGVDSLEIKKIIIEFDGIIIKIGFCPLVTVIHCDALLTGLLGGGDTHKCKGALGQDLGSFKKLRDC